MSIHLETMTVAEARTTLEGFIDGFSVPLELVDRAVELIREQRADAIDRQRSAARRADRASSSIVKESARLAAIEEADEVARFDILLARVKAAR